MVGYGMAALLCRAFWPGSRISSIVSVAGLCFYLWLGLAMSGPILLFRRKPPRIEATNLAQQAAVAQSRTWAELAWMIIGVYWIVVSLIVIPARLRDFRLGDMVLFGMVPLAVALGMRLLGSAARPDGDRAPSWTHGVGVVLLVTWPVAWVCLIVVGKTLP